MISESINPNWKTTLARTGDARVFGEHSDVRRKMDHQTALQHFAEVWQSTLEPEVRKAPVITTAEAKELLEGKQRDYAVEGYRQFSLYSVVCVPRLNHGAAEEGNCDQLWPLGAHRDNTRLCVYIETVADKRRFEQIARELHWEPKKLALQLTMDFIRKFPTHDGTPV